MKNIFAVLVAALFIFSGCVPEVIEGPDRADLDYNYAPVGGDTTLVTYNYVTTYGDEITVTVTDNSVTVNHNGDVITVGAGGIFQIGSNTYQWDYSQNTVTNVTVVTNYWGDVTTVDNGGILVNGDYIAGNVLYNPVTNVVTTITNVDGDWIAGSVNYTTNQTTTQVWNWTCNCWRILVIQESQSGCTTCDSTIVHDTLWIHSDSTVMVGFIPVEASWASMVMSGPGLKLLTGGTDTLRCALKWTQNGSIFGTSRVDSLAGGWYYGTSQSLALAQTMRFRVKATSTNGVSLTAPLSNGMAMGAIMGEKFEMEPLAPPSGYNWPSGRRLGFELVPVGTTIIFIPFTQSVKDWFTEKGIPIPVTAGIMEFPKSGTIMSLGATGETYVPALGYEYPE